VAFVLRSADENLGKPGLGYPVSGPGFEPETSQYTKHIYPSGHEVSRQAFVKVCNDDTLCVCVCVSRNMI